VRVTLIHNPGAGSHGAEALERLQQLIGEAGHELRLQSCRDDGWERALSGDADLVAVAGGDGTVARVIRRMAGRGTPVAPLPAGTANNIATALGIVGRPLEELVAGWSQARRVKVDVGVARGPWGERTFIEGLGAGLFAEIVPEVDSSPRLKALKTPADKVAFALRKLRSRLESLAPVRLRGALDGRDVSGEYVLFEAMNVPYIGPNLFLAPDSKRGDAQMDLVMATPAERDRLLHYLESWQEERDRLAVLPTLQGEVLTLEWSGYPLHIDDEFWPGDRERPGSGRIEARLQGCVEVLVPPAARKAGQVTRSL
jgi:diacylglycerol kinase family enzyme